MLRIKVPIVSLGFCYGYIESLLQSTVLVEGVSKLQKIVTDK